jgi:surfeit locus 1 family protein
MARRSPTLLIVILVVAAAVFVRLGIWQLHRLQQRRAANTAALAARERPEVELARRPAGTPITGRRVIVRGTYDRSHEFVVRGQVVEVPGVEIVTPLRIAGAGDTAVLVDRGFVPAPDAATVPADLPLDEPGEREVRGLALPIPQSPDSGQPITHGGRTTWRRLDLAAARSRLDYPLLAVVVQQAPDPALPRFPRRREPPPLDNGPHLSYAIQWFSFATMALVFGAIVWRKGTGRPVEWDRTGGPADSRSGDAEGGR